MTDVYEWSATGKNFANIVDEQRSVEKSFRDDQILPRMNGTYWTKLEDIWDSVTSQVGSQDFIDITRDTGQALRYENCYVSLDVKIRGSQVSSSATNTEVRKSNPLRLDACGNLLSDAAHLISNAQVCHKAYGFLAEAAVGHRVQEKVGEGTDIPALKRRKILVGVEGVSNSSLKGHKLNKMYLKDQKNLFDTETPSMLIIPCLSLQEVKDWASSDDTERPYDALVFTFGEFQELAARLLSHVKGEGSTEEIENARVLLEQFVKGVAGCVKTKDVLGSFSPGELQSPQNTSLQTWQVLVGRIKDTENPQLIDIPTSVHPPVQDAHIAKIRLSKGNSLPDPWLVMAKAAINYSAFKGRKLMPACPPVDDDDIGSLNCVQGFEEKKTTDEDEEERSAFRLEALKRGGLV